MTVKLKFFNIIFHTCKTPEEWLLKWGVIKPIYKKGKPLLPNNYKPLPLTLARCLGKFLTFLVDNIFTTFIEVNGYYFI